MSEQIYIAELHNDHTLWLSELSLGKDQLKSYQNRLEEVAKANTGNDVLALVEQFQNRFIRENEVIDILLHDIRADESTISASAAINNVATDRRKVSDNDDLRSRMVDFRKIFDDLKMEFIRFLAKTY